MFKVDEWADVFLSKAKAPMDKQSTNMFMSFLLEEASNLPIDKKIVDFIGNDFLAQILEQRAQAIGLALSPRATVFLRLQSSGPGDAVMYVSAIRAKTEKCDMSEMARLFPEGFVAEAERQALWDMQKGHVAGERVDNCLDAVQWNQATKATPKR
jgi:hypothetical protein